MVISRSGCATWIAASPIPGAAYMVSNMSVGEPAHLRRDFFDWFGDQPQLLVGEDDDSRSAMARDLSC